MCEEAARVPALDRPALTATIGLDALDAARDAVELAGVPEGLEIQEDHVGGLVLFPPGQEVVPADVALVAHRDEARNADAAGARFSEDGDAEATGLGSESESASGREVGREGGVHRHVGIGVDDAKAVGPDNPHAIGVGQAHDLALQAGAVGASLREARCHHDQGGHSTAAAGLHHIEDLGRG